MNVAIPVHYPRDYSLTGPEGRHAVDIGLASAQWYHSDVMGRLCAIAQSGSGF
jgi:hypothetical protein